MMDIVCACCGKEVSGVHHHRKFCFECAKISPSRRKSGSLGDHLLFRVGDNGNCSVCAIVFSRSRPNQTRCSTCQKEHRNASRRGAYPRPDIKYPVGTKIDCRACECEFEKDHNNAVYCPQCRGRSAANFRYSLPENKLKACMSGRLAKAIKRKKTGPSWSTYFKYSLSELFVHLEKQFLPNMTWENYGSWHVDHILPVASFDLSRDEEVEKCFAISNLRPLWAQDNRKKQAKRLFLV